ncbi:MAG: type II toxin-antitoxin system HigB family toxin [Sulfuricellaceae bacterium]|nr:type II toxin-antitoxin system HigB family toxin [Sulfuricellaceae bacterium]
MRIISHAKIIQAQADHPDSAHALGQWYRLSKRAVWRDFAEVKECFPAVDKVGDKFVFDVGGNKLRLIAAIHFNTEKVFVRAVMTHKEYDKGGWK